MGGSYICKKGTRRLFFVDKNEAREITPLRSLKVWNHSPDGFNWGYGGSGPAQLALAILLDRGIPEHEAVRMHQDFKWAFIALPCQEDFVIPVVTVEEWIIGHRASISSNEKEAEK